MSRRKRRRLLIVTAVEAEYAAVLAGLGLPDRPTADELAFGRRTVVAVEGVGMAAAAAATARDLAIASMAEDPFDAVLCAGIAGGFAGRAEVGATVLASRSVAADLGAESPDGFVSLDALGFGQSTLEVDAELLGLLRSALPDAVVGDVLTVSTVTGTAEGAAALLRRCPGAVAEAMEGFGVATAAARLGSAFAELRTIANPVGPRDRASWRIPEALTTLSRAAAQLREVLS